MFRPAQKNNYFVLRGTFPDLSSSDDRWYKAVRIYFSSRQNILQNSYYVEIQFDEK